MKEVIYYLCDRTACENCSKECNHTSDITHAKNFIKNEMKENGKHSFYFYTEKEVKHDDKRIKN